MCKFFVKFLMAASLAFASVVSVAEFAVIVHPDTSAEVSKDDLEKLYLAKAKTFADGSSATPLNHGESSATRAAFDSKVVGKSESQMKSYWAKLLFTGKAVPIKQVASDAEMVSAVASTPGAVGYVDAASVNDSVKVVLTF